MNDVLGGEDPHAAQWVTIDPEPMFAVVMNLPEQRWYCALLLLDGEAVTAITTSKEAKDTLTEMNLSGIEPPEEWTDWTGHPFTTRPGWPMHWLEGGW